MSVASQVQPEAERLRDLLAPGGVSERTHGRREASRRDRPHLVRKDQRGCRQPPRPGGQEHFGGVDGAALSPRGEGQHGGEANGGRNDVVAEHEDGPAPGLFMPDRGIEKGPGEIPLPNAHRSALSASRSSAAKSFWTASLSAWNWGSWAASEYSSASARLSWAAK